jgi:hypothetical protein
MASKIMGMVPNLVTCLGGRRKKPVRTIEDAPLKSKLRHPLKAGNGTDGHGSDIQHFGVLGLDEVHGGSNPCLRRVQKRESFLEILLLEIPLGRG